MSLNKVTIVLLSTAALLTIVGLKRPSNVISRSPSGEIWKRNGAYTCEKFSKTLLFRSDLGEVRLIEFNFEGHPEWPPLRRCLEIAKRAREFNELGLISYLTVERVKENRVVCVSKLAV